MIKAYKGFNKDLQCTPNDTKFQYEVGKEYEEESAEACCSGFHSCENPLDVFSYYPPSDSRYCEVEADGDINKDDSDSKIASTKIKIGVEIGVKGIIEAGVKFILDNADFENATATNAGNYSAAVNTGNCSVATNAGNCSAATNTGDCSVATNTGNYSAATNTGDHSAATNTGDHSAATVEGKESVAICTGIEGKAKGALGCWLVLAEWVKTDDEYHLVNVKSHKVDGKILRPGTFYVLKNNEFKEVK